MNTPPDLSAHPAVQAVRATIATAIERVTALSPTPGVDTELVVRALVDLAQALEQDPMLGLDPQTPRLVDLLAELVCQLGPLTRQAALVVEAERLEQDTTLTEPDRSRALMRLGKLNPHAPAEAQSVATRIEELTAQIRERAVPGGDTLERRRSLAEERLDRRTLAEAAALLRYAVRDAAAIAPDLPEIVMVLAAAETVEQASTGTACAAPGCAAPLPPAAPGRVRRYCSPGCRTRARRRPANR